MKTQEVFLRFCLQTLGDDLQTQAMGHADNGSHHDLVTWP